MIIVLIFGMENRERNQYKNHVRHELETKLNNTLSNHEKDIFLQSTFTELKRMFRQQYHIIKKIIQEEEGIVFGDSVSINPFY